MTTTVTNDIINFIPTENDIKIIHEAVTLRYRQCFNIRPAINKVPICLKTGTPLDEVTTTAEQIEEWTKPDITLEQWEIDFYKTKCEATDQQIENIKKYGYFANGFNILMGKLRDGKYYATLFDFDSEQSLKDFLHGRDNSTKTTIQDLSKLYYIEHHIDPYYKLHIIVKSNDDKPFGQLSETDKLGTDIKIGLGIDPKGWCATAPSPYMNNNPYRYTKIEGGIDIADSKIIKSTSKDCTEYMDLFDRIAYVKSIHRKRYKDNGICKLLEPHLNGEGERHYTWLYFIGMLCKDTDKEEKEIEELVTKVCEYFNDNELEDRLGCIDSTLKLIKESNEDKVSGYKGLETIITDKEKLDKLKVLVGVVADKNYNNETDEEDEEKGKTSRRKKEKLIKELYKQYHFTYNTDTKILLIYENGVYKNKAEIKIKNAIEKMHPYKYGQEMKGAVIETIKDQNPSNNEDFDNDINILNIESGLYNVLTEELKPHTPEYLSVIQHPVIFDPHAKCPRYFRFLTELVDDPYERLVLIRLTAITLRRNFEYSYETYLWGDGDNGKSVYCKVLKNVLGQRNCSAESLDDLIGRDKFSRAQLFGKCANFDSELTTLTVKDSAKKKKLTSDDLQSFRNLYSPAFTGVNFAKLWFNGNRIPVFDDNTGGRYRREVAITCGKAVEKSKRDRKLAEKLDEERSGIFNILRNALRVMLLKPDVFELNVEKQREKMELITNPKDRWFEERVDLYTGGSMRDEIYDEEKDTWLSANVGLFTDCFVFKRELYNDFISWCKQRKLTPTIASTRIQDLGTYMEKMLLDSPFFKNNPEYKTRIDGEKRIEGNKKGEVWYGVRLKPNPEELKKELRKKIETEEKEQQEEERIIEQIEARRTIK
jgi:P4 family phage/plasmid primase-like protien